MCFGESIVCVREIFNLCMEAREGMSTGVTVIGAEAPSVYHVAPRTEIPSQTAGSPRALTVTPVTVGLAGSSEKKKRGRPRKYGPDGTPVALSPMPISSSVPHSGDFSSGKRGRGKVSGFESKHFKKMGADSFGMTLILFDKLFIYQFVHIVSVYFNFFI